MCAMKQEGPEKAATRSDWKTQEMPAQQAQYILKKKLTSEQLETLKCGHVPQAMEDKWFWFYEDDRLYIHRSWTGICIYILRFHPEAGKILVISNRDPKQYKCTNNQEDAEQLSWLLDSWSNPDRDYRQEWMTETVHTIQKAEAKGAGGNSAKTQKKQNNISAGRAALRDHIRGSLFGGAAGDALGYAIEFMREPAIFAKYGSAGITAYDLDFGPVIGLGTGKGLISDDTQMTLFTANGLLCASASREKYHDEAFRVRQAYQDWYLTQLNYLTPEERFSNARTQETHSWLMDIPDMYYRRAPGHSCLQAIERDEPLPDKKGCGGVMRVAPVALLEGGSIHAHIIACRGAEIAAITHGGHTLGYMPAWTLTYLLCQIIHPYYHYGPYASGKKTRDLNDLVLEARKMTEKEYAGKEHLQELLDMIDLAVELSGNGEPDISNIHRLGEGWVAEEALGISLYCAMRYQNDFSAGIIAAANHNGDSDSTAAITGNILGAWTGYDAIEAKWKQNLELSDVILEMADDIWQERLFKKEGLEPDENWKRKYLQSKWKAEDAVL